jgi:hypothetical protein
MSLYDDDLVLKVAEQEEQRRRWIFGYTPEQLLQFATDLLGEQLEEWGSNEPNDSQELLDDTFPAGERSDPLKIAAAVVVERAVIARERNDARHGGPVTVAQFKHWCDRSSEA